MGEPFDPRDVDSGGGGDLLNGGTGADAGLNFPGSQRTLHFDLDLPQTGQIAPGSCTESVVGVDRELVGAVGVLADHSLAVG
ncbi:Uncharacterised protein [Mycobacteroides abscessus subsp. abscessus]|nr:Uncharacterised protein [Mycobacteroides abscessus subsp. abscessus]SIK22097.1 Uncharacterised protein [Mycobacteroides abscessus subsp. abscessus]